MFKSIIKIAAATALFAVVHTLFASKTTKKAAIKLFGERRRNALYRPFYNAQAVIFLACLGLYGMSLPNRTLYRVRGTFAWAMHVIQFCFLLYLLNGVRQIGFLKFAGLPNIAALLTGQTPILPEPEGQGPIIENKNQMKAGGVFKSSRHPLNFGMIPIIWLMPRMTVNLAAFNVITTLYLFFGSFHEEKRLKEAYGQAYVNYQKSGINFLVPAVSDLFKTQKRLTAAPVTITTEI